MERFRYTIVFRSDLVKWVLPFLLTILAMRRPRLPRLVTGLVSDGTSHHTCFRTTSLSPVKRRRGDVDGVGP